MMETEKEKILIKNAKEFYGDAMLAESKKHYNSSVSLFFKSLAVLADLYILRKDGKIPSNHSERFRILETKYPDIYRILDKDFPYYQDSYSIELNKEINEVLKKDVKELFRLLAIN